MDARCLLCREINNMWKDFIKVNSTQWEEFKIQNIIEQHLWPLETIQFSSWICATCWHDLYDFHTFYKRIEAAHKNIEEDSLMKLEFLNEETHIEPPPPTVPETQATKLSIIIKEEHEDFLEDDMPLMKLTKRLREATRNITYADNDDDPLETLGRSKETKKTKLKPQKKKQTKTKHTPETSQTITHEAANSNEDSDTDSSGAHPPDNENKSCHTDISKPKTNREIDKFIAENIQIECLICKTPAETFQALGRHFKDEHNQRGYILCCNKKYFKRNHLLDHVHQHLDPNYLKCNHCDKVLANRRCLKFHKKIHDTEREKNHCCDVCGLRFVTSHLLNNHKTIHLTDEEKMFPCSECGKNFGTKWILMNHVKLIHESTISCDICGLILVNKSVLNRHKYVKHPAGGPLEFICPICSRISTNLHAHNTHVKYAHHTDYNFKCTICEKAFKKPRSLKEHMAKHTGTDLYSCPWCPITCKSSAYMNKHHKKFHPKEWLESNLNKYGKTLPPDKSVTTTSKI